MVLAVCLSVYRHVCVFGGRERKNILLRDEGLDFPQIVFNVYYSIIELSTLDFNLKHEGVFMKKSLQVLVGLLAVVMIFCSYAYAADPAATQKKAGPKYEGVVNINTATVDELKMLPGIGDKIAKDIVAYRQTKGTFALANDLLKVKGIGQKKFDKIKPYIVLEGKSTLRVVK
jgi:competence protein ComEA